MVKANVMPIVNTDITILLKLCPFLWFFDVFRSIKKQQQQKNISVCTICIIYLESSTVKTIFIYALENHMEFLGYQ